LVDTGKLDSDSFTFYLGDHEEGELVIGGVDWDRMTDIHYLPVIEAAYWKIAVKGIFLNSRLVSNAPAAIVDSGTSLITGPPMDVMNIAIHLGAVQQDPYLVPCRNLERTTLSFLLGDRYYDLRGPDLSLGGPDFRGLCVLGLEAMEQDFWILGDVFLRRYTVEFDWGKRQIGFSGTSSRPVVTTTGQHGGGGSAKATSTTTTSPGLGPDDGDDGLPSSFALSGPAAISLALGLAAVGSVAFCLGFCLRSICRRRRPAPAGRELRWPMV